MRVAFVVVCALLLHTTCLLGLDFQHREYGIAVATVESPYHTQLVFHLHPTKTADTVALFMADTIAFVREKKNVHAFERMIELSYHEIGFPILEFSPDSEWVRVSLNCHDLESTTTGWLWIRSTGLRVLSWSEILPDKGALFFLNPHQLEFYSVAEIASRIHPDLVGGDSPDYQLYPIRIDARWMLVELETPSSFCKEENEQGVKPTRRAVWIEFLDKQNRPRVFYYTRGC